MTGPESGPLVSPGFWLHQAALRWRAELDARLRPLGLTHTQFILLASVGWLEHVGEPPTQQEVAVHAGADRMMTSRVVRTLAERGLIRRTADESDGRSVRLHLTVPGRELAGRGIRIAQDLELLLFGDDPARLRGSLRELATAQVLGR